MPELPEVETIARNLREGSPAHASLLGRRIEAAHLLWERTLAEPDPQDFSTQIIGQSINGIGRRAKFLVFNLTQDTLLIHLRMSGDLIVRPLQTLPAAHDRLVLGLEGGLALAFNDTRKFGRAWLTPQPQRLLDRLGPEPLDETLSETAFYQRLHAARRQLKPLLMDQSFLAGLGNIYTDEALHAARLHPLRRAHTLSRQEAGRLLASIRAALTEGIRRNGASIDWVYRGGDFQNYFRVYQRTGQPCPACGAVIQRMVVGQRGTHFCPACQKQESSREE